MKKRTKIIILAVMVLLLGVTGYLNIVLNNSIKDSEPTTTTTTTYFASYRQSREEKRERELSYYKAIVEGEESSEDEISTAKQCMLDLVSQIEKELVVEGLIKGLGFEDCVITLTDKNVNVIVQAPNNLVDDEVAKIVTIVGEQLGATLADIKIMPIK